MARSAPPTAIPKTVGPEQRGPPETGRRGAPAYESSRAIDNRSSTRFFSFFEGLNTATRRAGIGAGSPVFGLRPIRGPLSRGSKVPKPEILNGSPATNRLQIV